MSESGRNNQWKSNPTPATAVKPKKPISKETLQFFIESINASENMETTVDKQMRELRNALGYTDEEVCF